MTRDSTPRGPARREAAVQACATLLIREGRGALSMRRVAGDIGISLGNLQYYFPNEATLLGAVVQSVLEASVASLEATFGPLNPSLDLEKVIAHLLELHRDRDLCLLFFEIWSIASRDSSTREMLEEFYEHYVDRVVEVLPQHHESRQALRSRARAVVALLEGTSIFAAGLGGSVDEEGWIAMRDAVMRAARQVSVRERRSP